MFGCQGQHFKETPTSLVCLLWQDDLSHPVLRPVPGVQVFHVVYVHVHLVVTKMKSICLALKQSKMKMPERTGKHTSGVFSSCSGNVILQHTKRKLAK